MARYCRFDWHKRAQLVRPGLRPHLYLPVVDPLLTLFRGLVGVAVVVLEVGQPPLREPVKTTLGCSEGGA